MCGRTEKSVLGRLSGGGTSRELADDSNQRLVLVGHSCVLLTQPVNFLLMGRKVR